jgi:phosphonate transport system substrate-binding protein
MNTLSRVLVLVMLLYLGPTRAADCEDPKPLRFALIPKKNPELQLDEYRPLIELLEKTLERRIEIVHTASYGTVVEGLLAGNIDLAELGPASFVQTDVRDASITAFATFSGRIGPFTDSGTSYRSLLIVRRDRGFSSIASLRDGSVSLVDPASTSGALLPRHSFARLTGVPLERYFRRVNYAGSHDRAIQAVHKGLVDAAFVSSSRLDEAVRKGDVRSEEVAVLWKSAPIPFDPFVYRGRLCQPLVERIKQAFFRESAVLQDMFRALGQEGFVEVNDDHYLGIREIFASPP